MFDLAIFFILFLIIMPIGKRFSGLFIDNSRLSFLQKSFIWWGMGAGFLALFTLFIGLLGLLYRGFVIAALAVLFIVFINDIISYLREALSWLLNLPKRHFTRFERLLIFFLFFVWFFTFIGSLSPILGMDALSYHMRDTKLFIEAHKVIHVQYTRDSLWPFLIQMLFMLGMLIKGIIVSKLFHFGFGVFSIVGVYVFCRRYWQRANSLVAAAVFALTPAVFTLTTYAYTDLARVFYTICAFYAFFIWLDREEKGWFYLSAVSCGFLLGVKIVTADVAAIIALLYLFTTITRKKNLKQTLLTFLIWCGLIIAVCGIWYARSWIILGNPIFPFASFIFGHGWPEELLRYHLIAGIGIGVTQFFRIPWLITFFPDIFGGESLGVIFLIFLPALLFIRNYPRYMKYILFVTFCLYASWIIVFQFVRFMLPQVAFFSILVSFVYFEFCKKDKVISKLSTVVIIAALTYSAALSIYHNIDKFKVAFGIESQEDYLLKRERTYAMARYINTNLPKNSKVLVASEVRLFYFERDVALATNMDIDLACDKNIKYSGSLDEYLRLKGFEYLLYAYDISPDRTAKPYFALEDIFVGDDKELIKKTEFSYKDEHYVYELYKINKVNTY